ncbi:MAG: hypothetical protein RLZZ628_1627 [Bacteroidota bacterium]|jgi:hypothetical protein
MTTQFKTRQQLAEFLGIDPKTLRNYLKKASIVLGKGRIAPKKWDETVTYFVNLKEEKNEFPSTPENARTYPNRV